jgi:hypothetical protein
MPKNIDNMAQTSAPVQPTGGDRAATERRPSQSAQLFVAPGTSLFVGASI